MPDRRIPRGIINERVARTKFTLTRHPPASALTPFVQYYWILRWDLRGQPPFEQRVLPNLSVHAVFFPGADGVYGPMHDVFSYRLEGRVHGLGVRFRPGCFRPFLRQPVRNITDRSIPLAEVFGPAADAATESIRNVNGDHEMAEVADNLLMANPPVLPPAAAHAAEAVETIDADPGITRVAQLCAATGLGLRSLQRLFAEHIGCTPKWAIRVYRLNDGARRISGTTRPDYAGLAAQLGYSDQSHFTRDFRTVTGLSPGEYARAAREDREHPRT
ncbi:DUF6597 domain-containing transcriptional factor [Amycolatopsis sp. NPDC059027]|uniref:AraC family transcriptional regulator n=1 Tax=unclassified Amycolatopsis TaxID=2618356 RepID=UPI003671B763